MIRKITLLKKISLLLLLFLSCYAYSQERTCGMVEYMEEQMKDPEFAREYEQNQIKFKARLQEVLSQQDFSQRGSTIVIPVAVHFPTGNEADRACLEALAQNQIDILNADYSATNADISNWAAASSNYPGLNPGSANISFCIAVSNHPTGLDPELIEGNPCVTIGYNFGGGNNVDGNWSGYMNFVVRPIGGLGFSPLGGSITAGQAVTMDVAAFGSGAGCPGSGIVPGAPYNLGRTVTHELGHFYNLDHTFNADGGGTCGVGGDGIADTPEVANSTYGCPGNGTVNGCGAGQKALTMDYMDYVDDACMYMFTPGQMTVVDAYVSGVLQSQLKPGVCEAAEPGFNLAANNSPVFSCPTTDNQAVFNLSYTTVLGFNESTTFTAIGNPPGSTVTFSPTSMSADGNFTMTVGNLMGTAQAEYTITVTGTSGTTSVTENVDVLLKNTCTTIECTPYPSAENLNLAITDGSGGNPGMPLLTHVINVPDSGLIESITVNVDVSHTYVSDLIVRIIHPGGSFVDVWNGNCGGNDNFDITFDDEGAALACATPTIGTFVPNEALSAFNGLEASGDWTILLADFFAQDTGVLNDWAINICKEAPLSVSEFSALSELSIFPNPNQGEFTIKLNSNSGEDIKVDVYDIRGRAVYNKSYTNTSNFNQTINLNGVQSGMYLVSISDGLNKTTKKIIVE